MDRSDALSPAPDTGQRDAGQREKTKERGDRGGQVGNYAWRHYRFGTLESENRAANHYNERVNQEWFARERSHGGSHGANGRQAPAQAVEEQGRRADQRAVPAPELNGGARNRQREREPQPARSPSRGMPEKGEVKVDLQHGFNAGFSVSDPRNQVRMPYQQEREAGRAGFQQQRNQPEIKTPPREQPRASVDERQARRDHPRAQELRASSREILQRLDEPQHPVPQRPETQRGLHRPRGLER